jgi:hypothetical protein
MALGKFHFPMEFSLRKRIIREISFEKRNFPCELRYLWEFSIPNRVIYGVIRHKHREPLGHAEGMRFSAGKIPWKWILASRPNSTPVGGLSKMGEIPGNFPFSLGLYPGSLGFLMINTTKTSRALRFLFGVYGNFPADRFMALGKFHFYVEISLRKRIIREISIEKMEISLRASLPLGIFHSK